MHLETFFALNFVYFCILLNYFVLYNIFDKLFDNINIRIVWLFQIMFYTYLSILKTIKLIEKLKP